MAPKALPSPEVLRQLLRYEMESGRLFWRERGLEWFSEGKRPANSCAVWNGKYAGTEALSNVGACGYKQGSVLGIRVSAHRVCWAIVRGEWPRGHIDHISGDTLDNRMANLRDVTREENMRNCRISRNNTSGVNGVSWNARLGKWHARLGPRVHLGFFADKADAIVARRRAEAEKGFHSNHGRRSLV